MFAYEVWLINGSCWCGQGFDTREEAESEMFEFFDDLDVTVDYWIVKEIE